MMETKKNRPVETGGSDENQNSFDVLQCTTNAAGIVADKAAIGAAMRALWPRLRRDQHGPLYGALRGLIDALASLEHMKIAVESELTA